MAEADETFSQAFSGLRTAVAAGAVWLFTLDLWFAAVPVAAASSLAKAMQSLSASLGDGGRAVALVVASAVIGSVSQQVFRAPAIWLTNLTAAIVARVEACVLFLSRRADTLRRYDDWSPLAVDLARRLLSVHGPDLPHGLSARKRQEVYRALDSEVSKVQNQKEAAYRYIQDLHDQSSLRLALIVPLCACVGVLSAQYEWWLCLTLFLPVVVAFQALDIRAEEERAIDGVVWPAVHKRIFDVGPGGE